MSRAGRMTTVSREFVVKEESYSGSSTTAPRSQRLSSKVVTRFREQHGCMCPSTRPVDRLQELLMF